MFDGVDPDLACVVLPQTNSETHMSKPPGIRSGIACATASLMPSIRMYSG